MLKSVKHLDNPSTIPYLCGINQPPSHHMNTPPTIYLRRCDITGEGMNAGWLFGDGELYIKNEQDVVDYLRKHGGDYDLSALDRPADDLLQAAFELDICYWTEWEDGPEDGDTYYDADGNEYTHKA